MINKKNYKTKNSINLLVYLKVIPIHIKCRIHHITRAMNDLVLASGSFGSVEYNTITQCLVCFVRYLAFLNNPYTVSTAAE